MPLFPRYDGPPLIERICGVENLTLAWRRVLSNIQVARRGRSAGIDAVTLRDFQADWTNQMVQLADELREGSYRPLPPRRVGIPKASGGERAIAILSVRDRIAQRAVQQVLEPLFEPLFLDCSYGCRPRIGVAEAVGRVARYADQGLVWVADADVASYFDTIDQRILMSFLRQRVDEVAVLRLVAQWLSVGTLTQAEAPQAQSVARTAARDAIARGGRAIRNLLAEGAHEPLSTPLPADSWYSPYAADRWGAPDGEIAALTPTGAPGLSGIGTALLLARPLASAARTALPYARRLGGRRLMVAGAVAAGVVAATELALRSGHDSGRGTPQGGALSPLLANIYLHPFDLALTSQGLRLVRFVDDFVIMCASREEAERALALARRQLATLRLALNDDKTAVVSYADGLEFLGQSLAPRQSGQRLEQGLKTFEEAQEALRRAAGAVRQTAGNVGGQVKRRVKR